MGKSKGSAHAPAHQQWAGLTPVPCPSPACAADTALPRASAFPRPTKHDCTNRAEPASPRQLEFPLQNAPAREALGVFFGIVEA